MSSKMIYVLRSFYSIASTCIRTTSDETDYENVTQEVQQGEVLSPYLFLLFISDIELLFNDEGCRGLSINSSTEVFMLGQVWLLFLAAARAISSATTAVGSILQIAYSLGKGYWKTYTKLFRSLPVSTLFYEIQVWGLAHINNIDKVQIYFFKRLLVLQINTPDWQMRLETGTLRLVHEVLQHILNWILRFAQLSCSPDRMEEWFKVLASSSVKTINSFVYLLRRILKHVLERK